MSCIHAQDTISNFDANQQVKIVEKRWREIELDFIKRVEKVFGISYPSPQITVYLTHNGRCTYNINENYFFVYISSEFSNNIIMHELLHFYTWHAFGQKLVDEGFSRAKYNDIKESLTELLNLEFTDLMNNKADDGYPQHKEMRAEIRKLWLDKKHIEIIFRNLMPKTIETKYKDRKYNIVSYNPKW